MSRIGLSERKKVKWFDEKIKQSTLKSESGQHKGSNSLNHLQEPVSFQVNWFSWGAYS